MYKITTDINLLGKYENRMLNANFLNHSTDVKIHCVCTEFILSECNIKFKQSYKNKKLNDHNKSDTLIKLLLIENYNS